MNSFRSIFVINWTKICYSVVLFLFITDLDWIVFPLSTRKLVGIVGLLYVIVHKGKIYLDTMAHVLQWYSMLIVIFILASLTSNLTEPSFLALLFGRVLTAFGAYYIYRQWKNYSLILFLKTFVGIVLVNDLFAMLLFCSPSVNAIFTTLQPIAENALALFGGLRFIGTGAFRFFEGGVINALAIVSTIYLYEKKAYSLARTVCNLVLLLFLGIFMARTTLIGFIGFLFFFYPLNKKKMVDLGLALGGLCVAVFLLLNRLFEDSSTLAWAFELVYSYLDGGKMGTESTDALMNMYVFPDTAKTWILGDGIWMEHNSYYMSTDVGYSRLLFLWGIIGTVFYFGGFFAIVRKCLRRSSLFDKYFVWILFLFLLVIMAKGFSDFTYFFLPVLFYQSRREGEGISRRRFC